jgi:hypothetical protein
MTRAAQGVLAAFDELSPTEQEQVAAAILRRSAASGPLSESTLLDLAEDVFLGYDAEESGRNATC